MLSMLISAALPLLLIVTLAGGLYLVARSERQADGRGHYHGPPMIVDFCGRALWCGPQPPSLDLGGRAASSAGMSGEGAAALRL